MGELYSMRKYAKHGQFTIVVERRYSGSRFFELDRYQGLTAEEARDVEVAVLESWLDSWVRERSTGSGS